MAPHGGQFCYDAKTSSFRLASDALQDSGGARRAEAPVATMAQRQLRRPNQLLYSPKTSCFYLPEDGPPHGDDANQNAAGSASATVVQIESEKKRQEAERSGASAGLAPALAPNLVDQSSNPARPFLEKPASSGSGELHHFMSQLWGGKEQEARVKGAQRDHKLGAAKDKEEEVSRAASDQKEGQADVAQTERASVHRSLAEQYKARAEIAEDGAARAWAIVQRLERQGEGG